ncbi:transposase [Streptomyces sp. MMCC 100]|uniref:transposase n=1 Tax=Streptomyces sp. MMCC 100 TaxID=3163555 RepID=UPI00359AA35B
MIGKLSAQHRAVYFRDFLDEIDRQTDPGLAIHVICDNLSAHKAPVVHKWLLAHPRFELHFTPTVLDQPGRAVVRRTTAALPRTRRVLLTRRARDRPRGLDQDPERAGRPFKWTKTADQIIDRICRYCDRISGPGH